MTATPRRVEYAGPEGWTVWTDEDGVHVRSVKGDCLEARDLERLIQLVYAARAHRNDGIIPAPKPPTPGERAAMYGEQREEYDAKRAARVVYEALAPRSPDVPF